MRRYSSRIASTRRRTGAIALAVGLLAGGLAVGAPTPTTAAPVEPVVLDEKSNGTRYTIRDTNDGRSIYVRGDDQIWLFDPATPGSTALAADHAPSGGFIFPRLLGSETQRLLFESAPGTIKARSLDGATTTDFLQLPAGASVSSIRERGDVIMMIVDLGSEQKAVHLFPADAATVPAALSSYEDQRFFDDVVLLPGGESVAVLRDVGTSSTLSYVSASGVEDIATDVLDFGTNAIDDSLEIWYTTAASGDAIDLFTVATPGAAPAKLLTHPERERPDFERGATFNSIGDGVALGETVYSRTGAFEPWVVTGPTPPDGFELDVFIFFASRPGEEVVANYTFFRSSPFERRDAGSSFFPRAGTEATTTIPPRETETFADDVYGVVQDFSSFSEDPALALLIEEPAGTFGIRFRPAGGTEADEVVIDTGSTLRHDRFEIRFDDRGFQLVYPDDNSTLIFVSLLDFTTTEVPLKFGTPNAQRGFTNTPPFAPSDVVLIQDSCDVGEDETSCTDGARLMYVTIPSIWIDPALQSVVPARVLETRSGPDLTTVDGRFEGEGRIPAGDVLELEMTGRTGVPVPDTAGAVLLNVVSVGGAGVGFLTLYPCGSSRPVAANVNFGPGDVAGNAVLAKLGDAGKVCVYAEAETDVVIDVNGYVPFGGDTVAVDPARIYETRTGEETVDGQDQAVGRVAAGGEIRVQVAGRAGVPPANGFSTATAYLNVVAVNPNLNGFLTVYPCTEERPLAASVNYSQGGVAPNAVLSAMNATGEVCIYSTAETDLIVDVNGYTTPFGSTSGRTPSRFLETRSGPDLTTYDGEFEGEGRIKAGDVLELQVNGRERFNGAGAVFLNVVAVGPSANGFITAYPCDADRPLAASVNYRQGQIGYNAVFAKVGSEGKVCLYSSADTDLVVDVNGLVGGGVFVA